MDGTTVALTPPLVAAHPRPIRPPRSTASRVPRPGGARRSQAQGSATEELALRCPDGPRFSNAASEARCSPCSCCVAIVCSQLHQTNRGILLRTISWSSIFYAAWETPPYAHCTNDEVAMPGMWDGISPPSPYRPAPPLPPNAASCTARRPRHCHSLAPLEYSPHSFLTPPSLSLSSFASMIINTANLYNLSYVNVAKQSFVVISRRKS